eukprot:INCI3644.2.p3 GENE.INCI3644.2~~INCI3644.2.p3  ORF type:complete len:120 (-),score=2.17 INCI3644.2:169-528(-)
MFTHSSPLGFFFCKIRFPLSFFLRHGFSLVHLFFGGSLIYDCYVAAHNATDCLSQHHPTLATTQHTRAHSLTSEVDSAVRRHATDCWPENEGVRGSKCENTFRLQCCAKRGRPSESSTE